MPKYIDPQTVEVSVWNPDDPFGSPIYEGAANEAHRFIMSGQYPASIADPHHPGETVEVTLHVYNQTDTSPDSPRAASGNSSVYKIPDHLREYPWDRFFAERVARVMTEIFGFEATREDDSVTFTVGTLQFTMGENMHDSGTYLWTQDLSDIDPDDPNQFAEVVDEATIPDRDISYRGSWSPWEAARQFVRYAVPSFGKIAEKRAANADHVY